jgi:hypothetical protein
MFREHGTTHLITDYGALNHARRDIEIYYQAMAELYDIRDSKDRS